MSKGITEAEIENWLGSEPTLDDTIGLLTVMANGKYTTDQFASDVRDFGGTAV